MASSRIANRVLVPAARRAWPLAAQKTLAGATPAAAVEEFMHAVADSNLTRMAQLLGNPQGPAAATHNRGTMKSRSSSCRLFLHGVQVRTLGDVPASKGGMRTVTTELSNNGCKVTIPVNVVKAEATGGWSTNSSSTAAAEVNGPVTTERRPGNPAR